MDLTIHIPPPLEERLKRWAARSGVDESEYATRLILDHLPPAEPVRDQATLDLLAQWDKEDQTDDPDEIRRRQEEWDEFRRSMNENSLSGRPIYP